VLICVSTKIGQKALYSMFDLSLLALGIFALAGGYAIACGPL
jgi:hypothetical protein